MTKVTASFRNTEEDIKDLLKFYIDWQGKPRAEYKTARDVYSEEGANGSIRFYDKDDLLTYEKNEKGEEFWYYPFFSKKTKKQVLMAEKLCDGTARQYNDREILVYEKNKEGEVRSWSYNGKLWFEKNKDGEVRSWLYDGSKLKFEKNSLGEVREWTDRGKLRFERNKDGEVREWTDAGDLLYEFRPNGIEFEWDYRGNLINGKMPDGTTVEGRYFPSVISDPHYPRRKNQEDDNDVYRLSVTYPNKVKMNVFFSPEQKYLKLDFPNGDVFKLFNKEVARQNIEKELVAEEKGKQKGHIAGRVINKRKNNFIKSLKYLKAIVKLSTNLVKGKLEMEDLSVDFMNKKSKKDAGRPTAKPSKILDIKKVKKSQRD